MRSVCSRVGPWIIAGSLLLLAATAVADDVVVTLDGVTATVCDDPWIENGVTVSFVETTSEDCNGGGTCFFGTDTDAVWLYPARLNLDLFDLTGLVLGAEIDIHDYCGTGCTKAFMYEGATTVDSVDNASTGVSTLVLDAGGATIDRIAVSSCEGKILEVRITSRVVPIETLTWAKIKNIYR